MEPFKADTFYKIGKILDNLASTHGLAWRLGSGFYGEPETVPALDEQISQANRTDLLVWDMEKEMFMYIPPERAHYYHNKNLLSPAAMSNFLNAGEEIVLAGDCFAAGCWTASVMHSMRP